MRNCQSCGQPTDDEVTCAHCGAAVARPKLFRLSLVELVIILAIVGTLAYILVPNFIRARSRGQLTSCKSNLKNIGTALEMYSTDYRGRYPKTLFLLTPNYLTVIPDCPSAASDTYSASYRSAAEPDVYTFCCQGGNHAGAGIDRPGYPAYTSTEGLIERP
ncbi:MAG: hypothetical protein AB1758_00815 [Candidatus Eremiobacterota bacterium]